MANAETPRFSSDSGQFRQAAEKQTNARRRRCGPFPKTVSTATLLLLTAACAGGPGNLQGSTSSPTPTATTTPPTPVATIQVNDLPDGRIFQRNAEQTATIPVTGTYSGAPAAIEARVVTWHDGAQVVPWQPIQAEISSGTFQGALAAVPQGGWYQIEARATETAVTTSSTARFAVGALVACAGQSHISLWFDPNIFPGIEDDDFQIPDPVDEVRVYRHDGFADSPPGQEWHEVSGIGATVFANALQRGLGIPIGLLAYGAGGSALWQSNSIDGPASFPQPFGWWLADDSGRHPSANHYAALARGIARNGAIEALVWVQGHTEALAGESRRRHAQGLRELFARVREDSGRPDLPIILSLLPRVSNDPAGETRAVDGENAQKIRDAEMLIAEEDPNTHIGATTMDLPLGIDRVHHSMAGQAEHASRIAEAVALIAIGEGDGELFRGPRLTSFDVVDDTTIDVHIAHRGGSDITPTTAMQGFSVIGEGVILDASRHDSNTIRLTLDPSESITIDGVAYLQGGNPGGLDVGRFAHDYVHDDSHLSLPLEAGLLRRKPGSETSAEFPPSGVSPP